MKWLEYDLAGVPIERWLLGLAVAAAVFVAVRVLKAILANRLESLAKRTRNEWDDALVAALRRTTWGFYAVVALQASGTFFLPDGTAKQVLGSVTVLILLAQCGIWATVALSSWLASYRKRKAEEDPSALTHLGAVRFITVVLIWSAVLLVALENLGVRIGPLVAGLGVGGIAVALAVQNILGDIFASLSIVLDKPFVVGDFLIVGDYLGRVEKVGLKTTRIRSLSGEQLIFSNNDLLKSRLRNYGRMYERRVVFKLGVVYQTPRASLEKIPTIIREAVEAESQTRFDRSHFASYGDFSLVFETVYFVLTPDYNVYMDIQQAINLRIHKAFERDDIEFAYPTQTLFVTSTKGTAHEHSVNT